MKKEIYLINLKQDVIDSIKYFELESNEYIVGAPEIDESSLSEIEHFFDSINPFEINEIFAKVDAKYGFLLNYHREKVKIQKLNTIRKISIYFLIISVISVLVGIFLLIKFI